MKKVVSEQAVARATSAEGENTMAQEGANRETNRQKLMKKIRSLDETDDERKSTSKIISWILRQGWDQVKLRVDDKGWAKVDDLLECELLEHLQKDMILSIMNDSNAQKPRYEFKDGPEGQLIRAVKKDERKKDTGGGAKASQRSEEPASAQEDTSAYLPPMLYPQQQMMMHAAAGFPGSAFWPGAGMNPMMPYANPWASMTGAYPYSPYMQPMQSPVQWPTTASTTLGRYQGRIKSFNADKGFGFIACDETYAVFNRDVFLHKAHIGDMTVGTEVRFTVATNKQGMPQAKELEPTGTLAPSTAAFGGGKGKGRKGGGKSKGKERNSGKKGGKGGEGTASSQGAAAADAPGGASEPEPPAAVAAVEPVPASS